MTPAASRPAGRQEHGAGLAARKVAFEVIRAVQVDDAYANLLLPSRIRRARLNTRDAAFATELTYGTLRMLGRHDAIIEAASGRELERIESDVLDIMRVGAHQLLMMRTPVHAAVSATVDVAREVGLRRATGFVNAVLRKIAAKDNDEWDEVLARGRTGDALLAARASHPVWVIEAFRDALRVEGADGELGALLAADNLAPRVQLAALPGLATPEDIASVVPRVQETDSDAALSPTGVRGVSGDPAHLPAVAAGRLRVQDEGSQLAALVLTRSQPVVSGERWLDMCAGPGGKAALLAAEARLGGARLVANELVPSRANLVREALSPLEDAVTVVEGDGRRFGDRSETTRFDRILLDAPCTGLGALRRRPEARWRKQPEDLDELVPLQAALLDAAITALAPGGVLAYVTCSPHRRETHEQIERALVRHGDEVEQLDAVSVLRSVAVRDPGVADGPAAQLWPHRAGTDAMFIALLTRRR